MARSALGAMGPRPLTIAEAISVVVCGMMLADASKAASAADDDNLVAELGENREGNDG